MIHEGIAGTLALAAMCTVATVDAPEDFRGENAEIHCVGIYRPASASFLRSDVVDWDEFVKQVRSKKGFSGQFWKCMTKEAQAAFLNDEVVVAKKKGTMLELQGEIVNSIIAALADPAFCEGYVSREFEPSGNLKKAIAKSEALSYIQRLQYNREYLSFAFPGSIKPVPANYHSVSVTVKAGRKTILVLSSSCECRWQIQLEKGADLAGVILIGYYTQETDVQGVPVISKTHYDAKGKPTDFESVQSYSVDDENHPAFRATIKALTGRKMTTFVGEYAASSSGYVIKPSPK